MNQKVFYEFAGFRLDPGNRTLCYEGEPRSLRPTAFELLLVFVANPERTLTKDEVIKRVWGAESSDDRNFHVTLHAVRQALRSSATTSDFVVRDARGYRFAADVRVISASTRTAGNQDPVTFAGATKDDVTIARTTHNYLHLLVASALYAALYAIALILEIAYEFDRFGTSALKIAPLVFLWTMTTAMVGLTIDRQLTLQGRAGGLTTSTLIFVGAAALLFVVLTRFLPDFAVTKASFQTYPAQAAYLKDASYFILLSLIFVIVPFHSMAAIESGVQRRRSVEAYPKPWTLTLVLIAIAAISLVMTAHLLDNLQPGSYSNLFTQLVYLRGILYFGLGIICLWWYWRRLNAIKRYVWQTEFNG